MIKRINNWLDKPLTIREELKQSGAVMAIYMVVFGGMMLYGKIKEKEAKKVKLYDYDDLTDI